MSDIPPLDEQRRRARLANERRGADDEAATEAARRAWFRRLFPNTAAVLDEVDDEEPPGP